MSLFVRRSTSFELHEIGLLAADDPALLKISRDLGLGLNLREMQMAKDYFSKKRRNPTDVELQTIGQTWSEHCFHKTFKGIITTEAGKIQNLFKTYIARATSELNPSWCLSVFEDNAGIVELNKDYAIAVKVETHNHPSAIEPFGGAATGTGGVIRDVLGVWADPIACTDVLGFGPLDFDYDKLPHGVKHPKYLFNGVVAGIGCYGNNMGIPTVNGAIFFDESYVGNVVVYCGCVGLLPRDKYARHARPGDVIVIAGGRTGRDGIHGVTFASAELTEESEEISRPAVQIANPIEEEKLKRAVIEVRDRKLASGITDLGGGGLSSAVGEMAHRFGCGAHIGLEKIPLKHAGLAPWEIYVSESQERMLILIPEHNLAEALVVFADEEVEATAIGKLTDDDTLLITFEGNQVAHLEIDFLFTPPTTERIARPAETAFDEPTFSEPQNLHQSLVKLLSAPAISSREKVVRTYDHEVKGSTAIKPLHGLFAGPSDASVLKPLETSWEGIVLSCGMNPRYGKADSFWMAASAIDEALRNNTAVGGRRIALLDNFVWGSPERPDRVARLVRACEACYEYAKGFETPFISGKDSLYNESPLGPVTPTLLITAVGVVPDIRKAISLDLKTPGNRIYAVGRTYPELGGSEYYRLRGAVGRSVPKVRLPQARRTMDALVAAIDRSCVRACHDLSEGGLAVALAEMALSSRFGVELRLNKVPKAENIERNDFALFSESNSRFLVEVPPQNAAAFESLTRDVPHAWVGEVTDEKCLRIWGLRHEKIVDAEIDELRDVWKRGLEAGVA
jgi:phosphoribosylformylglycinamidine synthase II